MWSILFGGNQKPCFRALILRLVVVVAFSGPLLSFSAKAKLNLLLNSLTRICISTWGRNSEGVKVDLPTSLICAYTSCTVLSRINAPQLYAQLYSTRTVRRSLDKVWIPTKWRRVLVKGEVITGLLWPWSFLGISWPSLKNCCSP